MSRPLDPRLHGYQRRAVAHLLGTGERGAGLFLDMGLGKTAATLQALTDEHLPALVLAPPRVAAEVWEEEGLKWRPDLKVLAAVGTPTRRQARRDAHADVTVMTRDTVGDLGRRVHRYRTVILDELSGYKTKSTARWKATRSVTMRASHVWGLTGTPAPNGYHDLWGQVFLLDGGARLGETLTAFRDRYFNPGRRAPVTNVVIEWLPKPGAEDKINALLDDLCLSMKAEDYLELPGTTFNEVHVPLPPAVRRVYDEIEGTLVADLNLLGGPIVTAANAAVLSNRLRQICAGFLYDDSDTTRHTPLHVDRALAVDEVVEGSGGGGVLVFYQFAAERKALLAKVPGSRLITEPGAIKDWNAGRVRALIAHPQSAGHGLNLQHGGHTIVWSSLPWSLEEWMQANARLHRQGQGHHVMIHALIAPGTVDRDVFRALQQKTSVQQALLDYLNEDERLLR